MPLKKTKKTGNKWFTTYCPRCAGEHSGYSGKIDSEGREYVVCGSTQKKMVVNVGFWWKKEVEMGPKEHIVKGKEIMVRCEVAEDYQGNCHAKVKLPDGEIKSFHLNSFLPPNLKPYKGWEYDQFSSIEETFLKPMPEIGDFERKKDET